MSDLAQTLIHPGALPSAQPGLPKRRRAARLTPDPLLVIGLPSGNRGLVLDISENGLGFLAGEPIDRAAREVRFTIAARSVKLCEAVGNFVWRDAAGQRGGIQFTGIPDELRSIIRHFAEQQLVDGIPVPPGGDFEESDSQPQVDGKAGSLTSPVASSALGSALPVSVRLWAGAANAVTLLVAIAIALAVWSPIVRHAGINAFRQIAIEKWAIRFETSLRETSRSLLISVKRSPLAIKISGYHTAVAAAPTSQPPLASSAAAIAPVESVSSEPRPKTVPQQTASPTAFPIAFPLLAPVPPIPEPIQKSGQKPDQKPDQKPELQPDSSAAQKSGLKLIGSPVSNPLPKPAPADLAAALPAASQTVARVPAASPSLPAVASPADDQLNQARHLLQQSANPQDSAQAAQILWQAMQKGNVSAEIELANLYLTGVGVPKSCLQARVLLDAASSRGAALARQNLSDLSKYGCD